ncbi:MAG: hypothetical protein Q8L64_06465 [bacterium]|nr:hypothetical protein [bacterium]
MYRKTFIVLIILLIITALATLGWFLFLYDKDSTSTSINKTDQGLFPFPSGQGGTGGQATSTGDTGGTGIIDIDSSVYLPNLRKLWAEPAAGATFVSSSSKAVSVRFVDRATGHIYESPVFETGEQKISNVTIPQIYEALWSSNGREVIMRYLKDGTSIQSFYGVLSTVTSTTSTSTPPLEGYFLPASISEIAVAAGKILYLDPTTTGGVLIETNVNGLGKRVALSSDISGWLISRNGAKSAFLSTKPSGVVYGYGYILDVATGTFTNAMSSILGLNGNINPSSSHVFMSGAQGGGIASASFDTTSRNTLALSVATLADKCAWANTEANIIYCAVPIVVPAGTYPDDWYQGSVSFSDSLWKIDVKTGDTGFILDPQFDALEEMDMFRLSVSNDDSHIIFTNKKDMSLWLYRFGL